MMNLTLVFIIMKIMMNQNVRLLVKRLLILTLGGEAESGYDYVIVDGVAYDGDLSGIVFTSDSNVLTFSIDSDGSYTAELCGVFLVLTNLM